MGENDHKVSATGDQWSILAGRPNRSIEVYWNPHARDFEVEVDRDMVGTTIWLSAEEALVVAEWICDRAKGSTS